MLKAKAFIQLGEDPKAQSHALKRKIFFFFFQGKGFLSKYIFNYLSILSLPYLSFSSLSTICFPWVRSMTIFVLCYTICANALNKILLYFYTLSISWKSFYATYHALC
jgi:hypothetical protein